MRPRDEPSEPGGRTETGSAPFDRVAWEDDPAPVRSEPLEPLPEATPPAARDERPKGKEPRRWWKRLELGFMRLVGTAGIVGIATALGAILVSENVAGWITGLVIGLVSVILTAMLWSARRL